MDFSPIRNRAAEAATAVGTAASTAANSVASGAKKVGHGAVEVASTPVDPNRQKKAEGFFGRLVDTVYTAVGTRLGSFNTNYLEGKPGEEGKLEKALHSPISVLHRASDETKSTGILSKVAAYHKAVLQIGDLGTKDLGSFTHSITRIAFVPARMVAKLAGVEVAGAIVQNTAALAVGFATRAITMALFQTAGHLLPYALIAGAGTAIVAGVAALAVKVSPAIALSAGIGAVTLGALAVVLPKVFSRSGNNNESLLQQLLNRIEVLEGNVAELKGEFGPKTMVQAQASTQEESVSQAQPATAEETEDEPVGQLSDRFAQAGTFLSENKGKIALGLGAAATVGAGIYFRGEIAEGAVKGAQFVADSRAGQAIGNSASAAAGAVTSAASSTATYVSESRVGQAVASGTSATGSAISGAASKVSRAGSGAGTAIATAVSAGLSKVGLNKAAQETVQEAPKGFFSRANEVVLGA